MPNLTPSELDAIASSATASHASLRAALIDAVAEVRRLREAVRTLGTCRACDGTKLQECLCHYCNYCHGTGLTDRAREVLGEKGGRDGSP